MKHLSNLFFLAALLLFSQCNDIERVAPILDNTEFNLDVGNEITRTVAGVVIDPSGNPVANAMVDLFGQTQVTDDEGRFLFEDAACFEKHVFVKVTKPGFLQGSRSMMPTDGINIVKIKLLAATELGRFDAQNGGNVTLDNTSISMGGGFVDENGNEFDGEVVVTGAYLDPDAPDLTDIMPGSLRAVDLGEEEALLNTYGMLGVELRSTSGQKLQLAEGNEAELSMEITAAQQANAPATIPLWHFDDKQGTWVEEGSAKKVGNTYVGSVSHFSFWNLDIKVPFLECWGRLLTKYGKLLCGLEIKIKTAVGTRGGFSDNNGKFGGIMPANVGLTIIVCKDGQEIARFELPPMQDGDAIGDLICKNISVVKVTAKMVDCDGATISGTGRIGEFAYFPVNDGSFTGYYFNNINTYISMNSEDADGTHAITIGEDDTDLGTLTNCLVSQGEWITEFGDVISATYTITDVNDGSTHTVVMDNFKVFEDIYTGTFKFQFGPGGTNTNIEYFLIEIKGDHKVPAIHQIGLGKLVQFNLPGYKTHWKLTDALVNLKEFNVEPGQLSKITVTDNIEVKHINEEWHEKEIDFVCEYYNK